MAQKAPHIRISRPHLKQVGIVALFWVAYLLILIAASKLKPLAPARMADLTWGLASCGGLVLLTWLFLRKQGRTFADVGMRGEGKTGRRIIAGTGLGLATYALSLAAVAAITGGFRFSLLPRYDLAAIALVVATTFALSAMEEIGFRAYTLRSLIPVLGQWRAQLFVAVAFGLCHIVYGWVWPAVVFGVIPCALLFGAVAATSRGLAMPIAVHAALNLGQWSIGQKKTPGLVALTVEESAQARATALGPLMGMLVVLAVTGAWWLWQGKRAEAAGSA